VSLPAEDIFRTTTLLSGLFNAKVYGFPNKKQKVDATYSNKANPIYFEMPIQTAFHRTSHPLNIYYSYVSNISSSGSPVTSNADSAHTLPN
jgi:hypothetical protein